MTNTVLKAQIDLHITNETVDFAITPAEVGGDMKAIVDYVDQEIAALPIGTKTNGAVSANAVGPYPVLTFNLNTVNSNTVNDKVVLPATTEVGKEILVFAANNSGSFSVMANQAGTARISSGGVSSTSGNLSIGPNISVRFIHINNGYWKAEII